MLLVTVESETKLPKCSVSDVPYEPNSSNDVL